MTRISLYVEPKQPFSLEAVIRAFPSDWLGRLADPSANYRGGAMVRRIPAGDDVVEFRCLLGQLIPSEMEGKALGQWIDKQQNPESFELIRILYRTFGPTNWGRIGSEFDRFAAKEGNAAAGKFVREIATNELMLREEIPHEKPALKPEEALVREPWQS